MVILCVVNTLIGVDVQSLARHSSLQMTQKYIEVSEDACRRVVG